MARRALAALASLVALAAPCAPPTPPRAALADGPAPSAGATLEDAAEAFGLAGVSAGRVQAVDLDGDGFADLVLDAGARVLRNAKAPDGAGRRFEDVTERTGLAGGAARGASVLAWGDVDSDGDLDCFYGRYGDFAAEGKRANDDGLRSEIHLNDGTGRFTRKEGSGVGAAAETSVAATFFDADGDGVLDLYVGNWYVRYGEGLECFPSRLFLGRGDGTFRDVTKAAGMLGVEEPGRRDSRRPVYGVTHVDVDGDGDQDLLVCAYGRQWNVLWRNDGRGADGVPRFTDVADATGFDGDGDRSGVYPKEARENPRLKDLEDEKPFRSNGNTFDAAVADFDGDGDPDVFVGEITHWWAGPSSDRSALLVHGGVADGAARRFAFAREDRGIARVHDGPRWNQGDLYAGWLDLGNDGRLDLFVASGDYPDAQRLRFWRQGADHRFAEVTDALGVAWTNCTQPTVADFDHDGTADVCLGASNTRLSAEVAKTRTLRLGLFAQRGGGHWLRLRLEGSGPGGANRSALGAHVTARAGGVVAVRYVLGSRGHAGHVDEFALTFGLGAASTIDRLEVRWPDASGTTQTFERVAADRALVLRQGGALEER